MRRSVLRGSAEAVFRGDATCRLFPGAGRVRERLVRPIAESLASVQG